MSNHIIKVDGVEYDLTNLEKPFGMYPNEVRTALMAWPHGLEVFNGVDWERHIVLNPYSNHTYRAKPGPVTATGTCNYRYWEGAAPFFNDRQIHGGVPVRWTVETIGGKFVRGTWEAVE